MSVSACNMCDLKVRIYQNRHKTLRITLTGPGDLTGYKVWFSAKEEKPDLDTDAIIFKRNVAAGGSDTEIKITDGPNGVIEVYLLATDTESIKPGDYLYDLVIENIAGKKMQAIPPSSFDILQTVTKT